MKQMRSRFRLLTLLLACAFFLAFVLCTGRILRAAGFSLESLPSLQLISVSASPDPAASQDSTGNPGTTPAPKEAVPSENGLPGTDNTPGSEYNIIGL